MLKKILGVGILLIFLVMAISPVYADDTSTFVTGVTKISQSGTTTNPLKSPLKPIAPDPPKDDTTILSTTPDPVTVTPAYPSTKITGSSMANLPPAGTNPLQSSGTIINQATSTPAPSTATALASQTPTMTTPPPTDNIVLNIVDTLFGNFMSGVADGFIKMLGGKDIYQLVYGFSGLGNLEKLSYQCSYPTHDVEFFLHTGLQHDCCPCF